MKPSARVAGVHASLIRRSSDEAPANTVSLALGELAWKLPEAARQALAECSTARYGPQAGRLRLREVIAARYRAHLDEVLVTAGAQEALFVIAQAWLEPGHHVLVPDPGFPGYAGAIHLAGAHSVPYRLAAADGFRLTLDAVRCAAASVADVRMLIVNIPSNPTGAGTTPHVLAEIAAWCEQRDILLVADEVYRQLTLGSRVPSLREVSDGGIVVDSVSKSFGAAGLRVGWIVAPTELLGPIRLVHGYAVTCAAAPSQQAALALLENGDQLLAAARVRLHEQWLVFSAAARAEMNRIIELPDGGIFSFLPIPETVVDDSVDHCIWLQREAGVSVVPGLAFGRAADRYVRLSVGAPPPEIREGIRRLAVAWSAS